MVRNSSSNETILPRLLISILNIKLFEMLLIYFCSYRAIKLRPNGISDKMKKNYVLLRHYKTYKSMKNSE